MRLGIIGLPQSGKRTVFEALTATLVDPGDRGDGKIATIRVPDARVDTLSTMYNPRKTIYAQVEYHLPGTGAPDKDKRGSESSLWNQVRGCDALIHVLRNFAAYGMDPPEPAADFRRLDQELIFNDLVSVEKRIERLSLDAKRGKKGDPEEMALLERCLECLEAERPVRHDPELAQAPLLRGFAFLSGKPTLVLMNNADDDDDLPDTGEALAAESCMALRGKLEQELSRMEEQEAAEFLSEFGVSAPAADRVIRVSYELLGLMSFFTVGEDEVRAWTLQRGLPAVKAAGVIHSDFEKGFIRAEVLSYEDLMAAGTYPEARKRGTVRLEGKTYDVCDGDIINFRFNV
ncbi:MAG: DUF933 domain-containing protein [Desulfobacterales bacterium]|jgi:hypothetical protein